MNTILTEQAARPTRLQLWAPSRGPKPTVNDITKAIKYRDTVWIYYEPDGTEEGYEILQGFRLIRPFVFGEGLNPKPLKYMPSDKSRFYLRAYVVKEIPVYKDLPIVSLTNDKPYWRMFRMDKIASWKVLVAHRFVNAPPGYNEKGDKDIVKIIARSTARLER